MQSAPLHGGRFGRRRILADLGEFGRILADFDGFWLILTDVSRGFGQILADGAANLGGFWLILADVAGFGGRGFGPMAPGRPDLRRQPQVAVAVGDYQSVHLQPQ